MNAVGIDVSKGKSTVAVIQPFGVVIAEPFDVFHTDSGLKELVSFIKLLSGETKVVMEYTGTYYEPVANALHNAGIFVSVVNPLVIDDYDTNRVRKVKTDKLDALKIASYALDKWIKLRKYEPAETVRKTLQIMNRQCIKLNKILVMQKNSLIALLDCCFPNANTLFTSPRRVSDGHEKWVDFVVKFPHVDSVAKLSLSAFKTKYQSWCKKERYNYSESKAEQIHAYARTIVSTLPMTEAVKKMISDAAKHLNSTLEVLGSLHSEMDTIASQLPEYETAILSFQVNGQEVRCPRFVEVNGSLEPPTYCIKEGDAVEIRSYYTLGQIVEFMDVEVDPNSEILVNNRPEDMNARVCENFDVKFDILSFRTTQEDAIRENEEIKEENNK